MCAIGFISHVVKLKKSAKNNTNVLIYLKEKKNKTVFDKSTYFHIHVEDGAIAIYRLQYTGCTTGGLCQLHVHPGL